VTAALGYEPNGDEIAVRAHLVDGEHDGDEPVRMRRFVLTRDRWETGRRDDIEIVGLDACLPLLGLEPRSRHVCT
jgi:hypothetical protein